MLHKTVTAKQLELVNLPEGPQRRLSRAEARFGHHSGETEVDQIADRSEYGWATVDEYEQIS